MNIDTDLRNHLTSAYTGVTLDDPVEGVMRRGTRIRRARRIGTVGPALLGAAAIGAVALALPSDLTSTGEQPYTPGPISLVTFDGPSFPLSFEDRPDLVPAWFELDPGWGEGPSVMAGFEDASGAGSADVGVTVTAYEPENVGTELQDVEVDGVGATLYEEMSAEGADPSRWALVWERQDDQWVYLGVPMESRFDSPEEVVALAEDLVDQPLPFDLQVDVAPQGWEVTGYKDLPVVTLADPMAPERSLSVHLPHEEPVPGDQLASELEGVAGPAEEVVVGDQPAHLVATDTGWYLQALLPDGDHFVLQVSAPFTREQVLEVAETVTVR